VYQLKIGLAFMRSPGSSSDAWRGAKLALSPKQDDSHVPIQLATGCSVVWLSRLTTLHGFALWHCNFSVSMATNLSRMSWCVCALAYKQQTLPKQGLYAPE